MIQVISRYFSAACFTLFSGVALADGCVVMGPKDAKLTIEEYADFECSYCARGANTMKEVLREFPGKVKLVFRNMPLPAHPNANVAAKAFSAICLQSSSLAFAFQDELFANQSELSRKGEVYLYELAAKLGADVPRMKTQMEGPEVAKVLAEDKRSSEKLGFQGTPSFVIGSETVVGARPYLEIKQIVERQLASLK